MAYKSIVGKACGKRMDILSRVDNLSRGVDILSNLLIWGEGGHFVHHRIIRI